MELEIYNAFVKAGVSEQDAKNAVESINREIDKRYAMHAEALATRSDIGLVRTEIAELKTELIKAVAESQRWTITAVFAAVGLFAAIVKFAH